jgi:hypothetical protein
VKKHIYSTHKREIGVGRTSTREDLGIDLTRAGEFNEIYGNLIFETLGGIDISNVKNVKVYGNTFHGMSSIGIVVGDNAVNAEIYGNLAYDCGIPLRVHDLQSHNRLVYIYNNRLYSQRGISKIVFFHSYVKGPRTVQPARYPEVYFYHNSIVGGAQALYFNAFMPAVGGTPNMHFINNIFSSPCPVYTSGEGKQKFNASKSMMGMFDYNYLAGSRGGRAWFGKHNIRGRRVWEDSTEAPPVFVLPKDSPARGAGIDLSREFTIDGKRHGPLPGMRPGYFSGRRPDMGAVQSND